MEELEYQWMYAAEDRHWWFRGRRAVIAALLSRVDLRPLRVLDAGCGTGRNLELYSRLGEADGVDPSPHAIRFCRDRGIERVREGDATSLPVASSRYDLVAATDVLEHVEHDRAAAAEMLRVTRPGGWLLVTVPAYRWMWSEEDVRLRHFRRYTRRSLLALLEGAGWEPSYATYFNALLLPPIALARAIPRPRRERSDLDRTPRWADAPLSLPMRAEAALIRHGVRLPAGVSIGALCRRPG